MVSECHPEVVKSNGNHHDLNSVIGFEFDSLYLAPSPQDIPPPHLSVFQNFTYFEK